MPTLRGQGKRRKDSVNVKTRGSEKKFPSFLKKSKKRSLPIKGRRVASEKGGEALTPLSSKVISKEEQEGK